MKLFPLALIFVFSTAAFAAEVIKLGHEHVFHPVKVEAAAVVAIDGSSDKALTITTTYGNDCEAANISYNYRLKSKADKTIVALIEVAKELTMCPAVYSPVTRTIEIPLSVERNTTQIVVNGVVAEVK